MAKYELDKVTEPDENLVHFCAPPGMDQVTLCGLTDWIGTTKGDRTEEDVTCNSCRTIVGHIHRHKKPEGAGEW